jgi:hypothetical protein
MIGHSATARDKPVSFIAGSLAIAYHTIVPPHSGERLDLHEAIRVAFHNAEVNALRRQRQAA